MPVGLRWGGRHRRALTALVVVVAVSAVAVALLPARAAKTAPPLTGIHKIRHVVIVMQENRSFDEYFGTYPGADGIPPGVCLPDPVKGGCGKPYHDPADVNVGGPHSHSSAMNDIDGGKMDGFLRQAEIAKKTDCTRPDDPRCGPSAGTDVMGYKTGADIPNYWAYARNFVLQDHMFEAAMGASWPSHLYLVSGWSALCTNLADPLSCQTYLHNKPDTDLSTA